MERRYRTCSRAEKAGSEGVHVARTNHRARRGAGDHGIPPPGLPAARLRPLLPSGSASPATAGAIAFTIGDAFANGGHITSDELLAAGLTFVAGILAIAFLMNLLKRISFLPFVLYRVMLGAFLLVLLYG
ncbi:MAG: undecaprenyl-diphosphate phosphatase [Methyloceanibacter sp.]